MPFTRKLMELFSIDIRALAAVRIGLAIILLQDLARRAYDITIFYGEAGVLPSEYTKYFWTGEWTWSVHLLFGGSETWVSALFIVHALAAFALLIGFRTRLSTVVSWFLLVSLHNANQLILQGEDVLLRAVLLVSIFLPLGAAYSWDRLRSRQPPSLLVFNGWSMAYLLQMGFLYFFVSLYKHSEEWTSGSAIYYALSLDQYATDFGRTLLQYESSLALFTIVIFVFQSIVLFLLFSPVWTVPLRIVSVAGLIAMHIGFALSMHLAMFSFVSIVALLAFLPSPFWDALERALGRVSMHFLRLAVRVGPVASRVPAMFFAPRYAVFTLLGVFYIGYVFLWHVGNVYAPGQYVPFSGGFELPAKILRFDQRWNLFAPYPYRHDGWIVIPAKQADGSIVDIYRDGSAVTYERPDNIFETYPRPRWRRYFLSLWQDYNARFREPYAQYLCREWNATHVGDERIASLEVVYMVEWTPAPGTAQEPYERRTLISWDCATSESAR